MSVSFEDIQSAAERIRGQVRETPFLHSRTLSVLTGAQVFLKFENLQFTASFKERGALSRLSLLDGAERRAGVVAMSAGNHAQGVAHHATRLGIRSTIVMPQHTPSVKIEQTAVLGADVVLHGRDLAEATAHAHALQRKQGLCFVHPYDDDAVIAGQGTVALEMFGVESELDVLLLPIGGGGLIAGCAVAAHGLRPDVEVVGVQSESWPSMQQALAGKPIQCGGPTIANGIAVATPGTRTLPLVREHVSDVLLIGESALETAVRLLLEVEKTVVEGAGAAGLAALLQHGERFAGRRVGLVLCGGNIDPLVLSSILQRELVRSSRLARITVELHDVPGSLAKISTIIGESGSNILEVHHQRAFTAAPLSRAEVLFVLEARGPRHLRQIVDALSAAGFAVRE